MSYSSIRRKYWHPVIGFCSILIFVNACDLIKSEKISLTPDTVRRYAESNQQKSDLRDRATSETRPYSYSNQQSSDSREKVVQGINPMTSARANKKSPLYVIAEKK